MWSGAPLSVMLSNIRLATVASIESESTSAPPQEALGVPEKEVYGASPPSTSSGTVSGIEEAIGRAALAARRNSLFATDFSVEARVEARTPRVRASCRGKYSGELEIPPPSSIPLPR